MTKEEVAKFVLDKIHEHFGDDEQTITQVINISQGLVIASDTLLEWCKNSIEENPE